MLRFSSGAVCELRVHVGAQSYGRTNLLGTQHWYVPVPPNNLVLVIMTIY